MSPLPASSVADAPSASGSWPRRVLLPAALGLAVAGGWVRLHPPPSAAVENPGPAVTKEEAATDPNRLPPDASDDRVLLAATGGNITAAKAYLLEQLDQHREDYRPSTMAILAAVVASDPGWLEGYLDRCEAHIPPEASTERREEVRRGRLDGLVRCLWRSDPATLWRAAELSPRLGDRITSCEEFYTCGPLSRDNALRVLDPRWGFDDESLKMFCGKLPDPEVQARILDLVRQGRFQGALPRESLMALLDLQKQQPSAYRDLEKRMTPAMREDLAQAWSPDLPLSPEDKEDGEVRQADLARIKDVLNHTDQPLSLSGVAALDPDGLSEAASTMGQQDYYSRHQADIDREMRQFMAGPEARERAQTQIASFFEARMGNRCDPVQLMEWREALDEDTRDSLFDYYARNDPAGALKYAEEKMPPGPDRDALIEAATEEKP